MSVLQHIIGPRNPLRLAWHKGKAFTAALRFGFPARKLTVIGVTGTDGKTTTVGMISHILQVAGYKVGAASTAYMQIDNNFVANDTHLTSISPYALQKFLSTLVKKGCTHAVVEMSSHGLVQGRVDWTFPSVSCVTNVSMEHLDYHKSMQQYTKDKGKIFTKLRGRGTKVLHKSDASIALYSTIPSTKTLTYSTVQMADLWARDLVATTTGCTANLSTGDVLELQMPGLFNIENALCAISAASACDVPIAKAVRALETFTGMPGRMERIDEGQPFALFVDFAVSPQAYNKALLTLQQITKDTGGRVLVLCSSCGNRMKEKRPEIGRICSTLADVVVVTEDETYGEDPRAALQDVWKGVNPHSCEAHKIYDRREAIEFLCTTAKPGDAVVLCGMGPFATMNTLQGEIPWDERKIAREVLQQTTSATASKESNQ